MLLTDKVKFPVANATVYKIQHTIMNSIYFKVAWGLYDYDPDARIRVIVASQLAVSLEEKGR